MPKFRVIALIIITGLCLLNIHTEAMLWVARPGPDGYMSMKHPDYARIYYPKGGDYAVKQARVLVLRGRDYIAELWRDLVL